jgi:hypothetical protein
MRPSIFHTKTGIQPLSLMRNVSDLAIKIEETAFMAPLAKDMDVDPDWLCALPFEPAPVF